MIKVNPDRNAIVYYLWEKGYTVDQIALEVGIPRSTVGYYVRKFNKYAKDGRPIVFPQNPLQKSKEDKATKTQSALRKILSLGNLIIFLKSGRLQELYYALSISKLLKELEKDFFSLTPEEISAFIEALGIQIEKTGQQ